MGIGAAAIMPATLSILTNVFTAADERARAIGIWSGTVGVGVALGPVVGGWLLAHYWWGSVFLVNVPIVVCGLALAAMVVPNSRNPASKAPDPVGGALSILGMGLLLWGIIEAPNRAWTSPVVLGAIGAALFVLAGFVAWERRSTHPMLELSFFRSRRFSVAVAAMAFVMFALMGALFVLTQYLQFSLGYTALQTGVRIAPIAAVLLVVAPLSAMVVRAVGTKPVVFAGMALIAVGLAALSQVTARSAYLDVLPDFFMIGLGVGLAFAPCVESVMGSLPREQAGTGSATNSAAEQTGGALGVAVLGSLLSARYQSLLTPVLAHHPLPHSALHLITGSLGGALIVAEQVGGRLGAGLAALARLSFLSGMSLALAAGAAVVGAAAVAVLALLPNRAPARGSGGATSPDGGDGTCTYDGARSEMATTSSTSS
jgi:EmrB/QacA subfamily drug resistance transporter